MLLASWRRHLAAQRMSPATLATCSPSVAQLDLFFAEQAMPVEAAAIRREHVEALMTALLERWKPATAHDHDRALNSFFGWLLDGVGEISESPMARMKPPRLPERGVTRGLRSTWPPDVAASAAPGATAVASPPRANLLRRRTERSP